MSQSKITPSQVMLKLKKIVMLKLSHWQMRKWEKDIFYLVDIACFHEHGMAIKLIWLLDDISGVGEENVEKEKRSRDGCNGSIGKIEEMRRQ